LYPTGFLSPCEEFGRVFVKPLQKPKNRVYWLYSRMSKGQKQPFVYKVFGATLGAVVMFFLEALQIVVIAAAIIIPVRYFLVQPFIVKGASMEPNFYEDDYLIVDELSYRIGEVERGDVVVFRPPTGVDDHYIKRVIGLPGETVEIKDGVVRIFNDEYPNGTKLDEAYINEFTAGYQRVTLSLNEYFVLGDNRDESLDSRKFGPVNKDLIVGRAWIRGLPIERLDIIALPSYLYTD